MNPRIRLQYYQILGVPTNAGLQEIKKAYRQLVHKYHPDSGEFTVNRFKKIQEAYSVLRSGIEQQYSKKLFNTPKESYHFSVSQKAKPKQNFSNSRYISSKFNEIVFNTDRKQGSRFSDSEQKWNFRRKLTDPNIINLTTTAIKERLKCSKNRYVRYEALRILTFRKGKQSFEAILKTAFDPDFAVREKARQHLKIYIELHGAVILRHLFSTQSTPEKLKTIILFENMKYREVLKYLHDYVTIEPLFLKNRIARVLHRSS